ncbi:Kruppel-like factor 2 [Lucilia cuprina]|uniref:Kruppel-like factor 2 n=1 Tax=Lucilia cuprina TaxID=7375 RepID=UPI001F070663|nr:Kruppel-like factor 2 [Lucilia cuprina]
MDFFADGGFQQLFCDLNEQVEQDYNSWFYSTNENLNSSKEEPQMAYNISSNHHYSSQENSNYSSHEMALNEKHLQASLDYLLNNSSECLEFYDISSLTGLSKDLAEWEEKFLDNYIEIPELVDFLPEKTPLCTDNCNHFLQESAENLKLLPTPPNSPASADKTYSCTFADCCKVYAKPAHLKAHLRRHLGEKPYICNWPNCTWRFSRSDELARHRRSHSGVKPYKCDFCAKCFARSDHLTKHRKVHERRLLAATKAGKTLENGKLPASVLTVRPGRKRKNQL